MVTGQKSPQWAALIFQGIYIIILNRSSYDN